MQTNVEPFTSLREKDKLKSADIFWKNWNSMPMLKMKLVCIFLDFTICTTFLFSNSLTVKLNQWDCYDCVGDTPLVHAARQGQIETAKYLLEHGADPNIASELGATALHHAAGTGWLLIALLLVLFYFV